MKTILAAATALAFLAAPAMAAPSHGQDHDIILAKKGEWSGDHGMKHRDWRDREAYNDRYNNDRYDRGDRYRGWSRYSSRPYDWRDRGCISVGPLWYCQ
jgi:hypothetical protein